jgi:hypothetical protein
VLARAITSTGPFVDLVTVHASEIERTMDSMARDGVRYACVVESQRDLRGVLDVVFLQTRTLESKF